MSRLAEPVKVVPNIIPMIDIISQLVIFFMLATKFISAEVDLEIRLPELDHSVAVKPDKPEPFKVVLNVKPDPVTLDARGERRGTDIVGIGDVTIGATSMYEMGMRNGKSWPEALKELLTKRQEDAKAENGQLICVIRADNRISWSGIQQLMFIVAQAKVTEVKLGAPLSYD